MMEFSKAMGLTVRGEVRDSDDPVEIVRQVVQDAPQPFDGLIVIDRARGMWLENRALDELRGIRAFPSLGSRRIPRCGRGSDSTWMSYGRISGSSSATPW
jgi:hypothetical protein